MKLATRMRKLCAESLDSPFAPAYEAFVTGLETIPLVIAENGATIVSPFYPFSRFPAHTYHVSAGISSTSARARLYAAHTADASSWAALDVHTDSLFDAMTGAPATDLEEKRRKQQRSASPSQIVEPSRLVQSVLRRATAAACELLRVDQIVMTAPRETARDLGLM